MYVWSVVRTDKTAPTAISSECAHLYLGVPTRCKHKPAVLVAATFFSDNGFEGERHVTQAARKIAAGARST